MSRKPPPSQIWANLSSPIQESTKVNLNQTLLTAVIVAIVVFSSFLIFLTVMLMSRHFYRMHRQGSYDVVRARQQRFVHNINSSFDEGNTQRQILSNPNNDLEVINSINCNHLVDDILPTYDEIMRIDASNQCDFRNK